MKSPSTITGICARQASSGSALPWPNRAGRRTLDFKNKVVAITGAAGGIGQTMCAHFGALGASIAALDKSDTVKALPKQLAADNVRAAAAAVDTPAPERVRASFADLAPAPGPVDVLINNAGFSKH